MNSPLPLRRHFSATAFPGAASRRPGRRPRSNAAEVLEDRTLLTVFTVDTLSDDPAAGAGVTDGKVSLREAIRAGNTNAAFGDAAAGQGGGAVDSIFFDALLVNSTITLAGARLDVNDHLSIFGHGADRLTIDGNLASGVFFISGPGAALANVFIGDLTVARARTPVGVQGAGIDNTFGNLTLRDVAVTGCVCVNGGIANYATLTGTYVTVSGNASPTGRGGGIYNSGTLHLSNATISGNSSALDGGGIYTVTASMILRNVTVVGNRSDSDGNGTGAGGGVASAAVNPILENTLVAGNVRGAAASTTPSDLAGNFIGINDVVGHAGSAGGLVHGTGGNIVGVNLATLIDPVLRDNGGPLKTHRLLPRSVAIDSGSNSSAVAPNGTTLTKDGRGSGTAFPRLRGSDVDIGAFEAAPADDLVGFYRGQWWVADSVNGNSFATSQFAVWGDVTYTALVHGDLNGDGLSDVLGLFGGVWYAGLSTGRAFTLVQMSAWANVAWTDVTIGDLNGDGKGDVMARLGGQWWAALSTGTSFGAPSVWGTWSAAAWRVVTLTDLDGDMKADLLAYLNGQWYGALSTGTAFGGPTLRASWANVAWDGLGTFDAGGDLRTDVWGLYRGEWYVGRSLGTTFETQLRVRWADVAWKDPIAGDFDGDGTGDLAARFAGQWWVSPSNFFGAAGPTSLWEAWPDVVWQDVRTGDFDGDGRDDIAGRFAGVWRVGRSTGSAFVSGAWATWADVPWLAVAAENAAQVRYRVSSGGPVFTATGFRGPQPAAFAPAAASPEGDPLTLFWSHADEDGMFIGSLAAV